MKTTLIGVKGWEIRDSLTWEHIQEKHRTKHPVMQILYRDIEKGTCRVVGGEFTYIEAALSAVKRNFQSFVHNTPQIKFVTEGQIERRYGVLSYFPVMENCDFNKIINNINLYFARDGFDGMALMEEREPGYYKDGKLMIPIGELVPNKYYSYLSLGREYFIWATIGE